MINPSSTNWTSGIVLTFSVNITAVYGQSINITWFFNDTNGNSNNTITYVFTISNSLPVTNNISISPAPAGTIDDLVCSSDYSDADNAAQTLNETKWFNSSVEVVNLRNLSTIASGNTSDGEVQNVMIL